MVIGILCWEKISYFLMLWNNCMSRDLECLSSLYVLICIIPFQEMSYFPEVSILGFGMWRGKQNRTKPTPKRKQKNPIGLGGHLLKEELFAPENVTVAATLISL